MATYTELTQEQKDLLNDLIGQLRAYAGSTNQLLRTGRIISDLFSGGGSAILTLLDAGELVPNISNLAGAQVLTKEECETLVADINTALSFFSTQTKRELQVKAAGINAI